MKWLIYDWKYNRTQLIFETLGTIGFIIYLVMIAWFGNDVNLVTLFSVQLFASICHLINAVKRQSVNLFILNGICFFSAILGFLRI